MASENFSQSLPQELAQTIWHRYAVAPGIIQMKPMLRHSQQTYQWSLNRAPLSSAIQRRWLPGDITAQPVNWPELTFSRMTVYPEKPISRSLDNESIVQRKIDIAQDNGFPAQWDTGNPYEGMNVPPQTTATRRSTELLEPSSTMLPSTAPTIHELPETRLIQRRSDISAMRQDISVQAKAMETKQADGKMILPLAITPEGQSRFSSGASPAVSEDLGSHLLQRNLGTPLRHMVQPYIARQASALLSKQPVTRISNDPRLNTPTLESLSHSNSSSLIHTPDVSIQRTSSIKSRYDAETGTSQLPPERILPSSSREFDSRTLIQPQVFDGAHQSRPSLINVIQRQSQPPEVPTTAHSVDSTTPALMTTTPVEQSRVPEIDLDKISEKVIRMILNRMAVERERRGI